MLRIERPLTLPTRRPPVATPGPAKLALLPSSALPGHLPTLGAADVAALARRSGVATVATVPRLVAEVVTGVAGASGLCHLPTGETLVVDDDRGIAVVLGDGTSRQLLRSGKDLEGICASPDGKQVWVVQEGTRRVQRFDVEHGADGALSLRDHGVTHKLPKFKDVENKGWEGLAFFPGALSGNGDQLICVHEGKPRRIGIFALPDLDTGVTLKLPDAAKGLLKDLADVAVDPVTGHIFVVSDESQTVVEFSLERSNRAAPGALLSTLELALVSSFRLPLQPQNKPEGLAFDDRGRLWVSLDDNGKALVFEL